MQDIKRPSMDGILVIDKPKGWTSHDVVAKVRNTTKIKKVGHTGTLDPFATGVLPLTLGRATRLTHYFLNSDKTYRGVMQFGFSTTTFDVDGEPSSEDARPALEPEVDRLEEIFAKYVGRVRQTLPPYSAKKIHGKPSYFYARKGIDLGASTKEVTIHDLRLISVQGTQVEFELGCGAGTYARSLAHDVGRDYGCGAHLKHLRRIRSGGFPVEAALSMSDASEPYSREFFLSKIIPMRDLLTAIPAIVISAVDQRKVSHGMDINLLTAAWEVDEYRLVDEAGNLLALGKRLQTFESRIPQPAHWVRIHPRIIFA